MKLFRRKKDIQVAPNSEHLTVNSAPQEQDKLEIGNLMIAIIRATRDSFGIAGESTLHYLIYQIIGYPEFEELDRKYPFSLDENRPYSLDVHKALKLLTIDVSGMTDDRAMKATAGENVKVIVRDIIRTAEYDQLKEKEAWMDKHFGEEILPSCFFLTAPGVGIAEYSKNRIMNQAQRDIVDSVVRSYISGTY